jgi:DNA-binding HxlR family transcriptional regulator
MARPHRSHCPVACTLDIVGDRWSLLVIRDLATGRQHFDAIMASPEAIAPNILAERLQRLGAEGLIAVRRDPADRRRQIYRLTAKGEKFAGLMRLVAGWGLDNLPGCADPRGIAVPQLGPGGGRRKGRAASQTQP